MLLCAMVAMVGAAAPPEYVLLAPGTALLGPGGLASDAGVPRPTCCDDASRLVSARFISDDGTLVQLETLGAPADPALHCAATYRDDPWFFHQLRSYRVRVWVRREQVLTVLREPLQTPRVTVAAGLPAERLDGGAVRFGAFDSAREFTLRLPEDAVGTTYRPRVVTFAPRTNSARDLRLLRGVEARIGDAGVVPLLWGETWRESDTERDGTSVELLIRTPCAHLRARVDGTALISLDAGTHLATNSTHFCADSAKLYVRAGAKVYWPDGTAAGTTTGDGLQGEGWLEHGHRCFDIALQGVTGALPLCFRPQDLSTQPTPRER